MAEHEYESACMRSRVATASACVKAFGSSQNVVVKTLQWKWKLK